MRVRTYFHDRQQTISHPRVYRSEFRKFEHKDSIICFVLVINGCLPIEKEPVTISQVCGKHLDRDLYEHQNDAIHWLLSLREDKLCGILADEIGLGKTCTVIGLLSFVKFVLYVFICSI